MQQMKSSIHRSNTEEKSNTELSNEAKQGILYATRYFMDTYNAVKAEFADRADGLSFEALDCLFSNCAEFLIGRYKEN